MKTLLTLFLSMLLIEGLSQNDPVQFYEENDSINLYAFIGEKISIEEFDPNENSEQFKIDPKTNDTIRWKSIIMDVAFNVKYKVLHPVFNDLKVDTINFEAYDHYGRPSFENHEYVILYISKNKDDGIYFHQKYQFDAVIKNRKGRWKGKNGKSIRKLFLQKKKGVFKARKIFK